MTTSTTTTINIQCNIQVLNYENVFKHFNDVMKLLQNCFPENDLISTIDSDEEDDDDNNNESYDNDENEIKSKKQNNHDDEKNLLNLNLKQKEQLFQNCCGFFEKVKRKIFLKFIFFILNYQNRKYSQ